MKHIYIFTMMSFSLLTTFSNTQAAFDYEVKYQQAGSRTKTFSNSIAISHNDEWAAALSGNKVQIWNLKNGDFLSFKDYELPGDESSVYDLKFSLDSQHLYLGGSFTIFKWDLKNSKCVEVISLAGKPISTFAFLKNKIIYWSKNPSGQKIYLLERIKKSFTQMGAASRTVMKLSPDFNYLGFGAVLSNGSLIKIKKEDFSLLEKVNSTWQVNDINFSPNSKVVTAHEKDRKNCEKYPNSIFVSNLVKGTKIQLPHPQATPQNCSTKSAVFTPDGNSIFISGYGGEIYSLNAETGETEFPFLAHSQNVDWIEFSQSGQFMISMDTFGETKIWEKK